MIRGNYYEVAFAAYLRGLGVGFVPVDEARRTVLGESNVKSLDFIVVGPDSARLVVDVKGRKYPSGSTNMSWQNWAEEETVDGLTRWAGTFGAGFRGVLAFVYHIQPPFALRDGTPDLFAFKDDTFLIRAIEADVYRQHMRPRSKSWGTVHLPTDAFRTLVRPFSDFLR